MDGDVFSKVRRPGKGARDAIIAWLNGGEWSPFCAELCMDRLVSGAHGLPSLPGVLRELAELNSTPLLAPALAEHCASRIAEVVLNANGTELDLRLKRVAQACILGGIFSERQILIRFCASLLDRAIISGRGGLLEQVGQARAAQGRAVLQSIAVATAETLLQRPDAQRLGLSSRHPRLTEDSNLLEGSP